MKKRIYIARPLFSHAELEFNENVDRMLRASGFDTFLPQRDGHTLANLIAEGRSREEAVAAIFERDIKEIQKSDILLLIMDGRVPYEGACVELGIAHALGKECIGLKTDPRSLMCGMDNPLILGALKGKIAASVEGLREYLG